jgi:hypothetical protein
MIIFTVLGVLVVVVALYVFIPRAAFIVLVATIIIPKIFTPSDAIFIAGLILVVFAAALLGLKVDLENKVW